MSPSPPTTGNPTRQQLDELDALLQRMLSLPLNQLDESLAAIPEPPPSPKPFAFTATPADDQPVVASGRSEPLASGPDRNWRIDLPPMPAMPPMTPPPGSNSVFAAWGVSGLTATSAPPVEPRPVPEPVALSGPKPPWIPVMPAAEPLPSAPSMPVVPSALTPPPSAAPAAPAMLAASMPEVTAPSVPAAVTASMPPAAPEPAPPRLQLVETPVESTASPLLAPAPEAAVPPIAPSVPMSTEEPVGFLLWPLDVFDRLVFGTLSLFGPPGRWLGSPGGRNLIGWVGLLCLAGATAWGVVDYLGWTP